MVSWYHSHTVSWRHSHMVSWRHSHMVSWCHGTMVSWCRGHMVSWTDRPKGLRIGHFSIRDLKSAAFFEPNPMEDLPRVAGTIFPAEHSRKSGRKIPDPWPGFSLEKALLTHLGSLRQCSSRMDLRRPQGLTLALCTKNITQDTKRPQA